MKNLSIESNKTYSLFGKSGIMEEIKPIQSLPIGCKIYCYGYGMSGTTGAVISERDSNGSYKCVYISDYNSGFFTVDEYSRPHSKVFGIGNYYDDNLEVFEDFVLEEYILKAEISTNISIQVEQDKNNSDKLEKLALPGLYPHLIVNTLDDQAITKKNLVSELKKNFPLIKFSVKKEHYSTYGITWTDGVTEDEVQEVVRKFEGYKNDESGDFRDPCPSNFNKVFGDFKYVFCYRKKSEQVKACFEILKDQLLNDESYKSYPNEVRDVFYRTFSKTTFPIGSIVKSIKMIDNYCGAANDAFEFIFDEIQEIIKPSIEINVKKVDLFLVDYSEKAIAIFGETKEIKETLKELGGRFNTKLTYNDEKKCGWVFPKSKSKVVKEALGI